MTKRMPVGGSLDGWMQQIWTQARLRRRLLQAATGLGALAPALVLANPSGGQVVAGSATIGSAGSNGVIVNQGSQRAVINWQQFSIGSNQYVQFIQPDSSAVVLNRVTGSNPSNIFGEIKANGQVFLINPNGILFAPGSTLDVSGLTASTLDISDSDFMNGRYVFSKDAGAPDASVINQGNVTVTAGGYVVLAGDYVENDGVIQAESGKVLLAAGGGTTLTMDDSGGLISYKIDAPTLARLAGVDNAGSITAMGGAVVMTADVANALTATAVNNSGFITAHSVSQQGGEIVLLAQGGGIENSGTLDASADVSGVAGGAVIIRGGGHTQLTDTSKIDASGDDAKGGFIELSGHTLSVRGIVTTGRGGSLLIDPASIDIKSGNGSGHSGQSSTIGTGFIDSKLNNGSNVTIVARTKIKNMGGVGITATGAGDLTLAIGTIAGGTGCSAVGSFAACVGLGVTPTINHSSNGGSIDLTGLPINIKGNLVIDAANNADANGQITTDNLKANSIELVADKITVNGNLTTNATGTSGGGIFLHGHSGNADVITVTGNITANRGSFRASFSNEGGFGIGTITLQNNVTATGITILAGHINATGTLHATGSGEAASSRDVNLKSQHEFNSAGGASIHVANVISDHGNVTLTASGSFSAPSVSNIHVGAITAAQSVSIKAIAGAVGGGNIDVTGAISAGQDVRITASNGGGYHNSLNMGDITAGGKVMVRYYGGGVDTSEGTTVKVGNVDSQHSMSFTASDTSNVGSLVVKAGTLTNHRGSTSNGQGIRVNLFGKNPLFSAAGISNLAKSGQSCECGAGDIQVTLDTANGSDGHLVVAGNIKSNHGNVDLAAPDASIDVHSVSGYNVSMNGRDITFGNVTAASNVSIDAAGASGSIIALSGTTITARFINIDLNASYGGNIDLANLAASSAHHSAGILITADGGAHGNAHITIGGSITVNGVGGTSGFSSTMPHGGAPRAAYLTISASGGSSGANTIKVNGAINVTGHAGHFSASGNPCDCEVGSYHVTGSGGSANVSMNAQGSHGSVQLHGTTTVKGTDANVRIGATTIKIGALNVSGTGHTFNVQVSGSGNGFTSHNDLGRADVSLQNSSGGAAATIVTGNVTVSGKGWASLEMDGVSITAGNISVTASKATGARQVSGSPSTSFAQNFGLGSDLPGIFGVMMTTGSFSAGRASLFLGSIHGSGEGGGQPEPAQTVKVGKVTVSGVGEADLQITGNNIQTGSLSANAAAGKMKGSFSSPGGEGGSFHTSFNINGGEADVELDTGSGPSTAITITGGVTASGPIAGVNMFGHTIKVTKGITATGHAGGKVSISGSGTGGAGFTSAITAPGPVTGITLGGVGSINAGSINVGGIVSVKGPGMIGVAITGAKVTLGGLSASASNVATYKLKNTADGVNDTFTAGSVAVLVFDESGGAITGPAQINGDVTISAPHGNVAMGAQLNATGKVTVSGENIDTNVTTIIDRIQEIGEVIGGSNSSVIPSAAVLTPKLAAAGISLTATTGSIDLTGVTLTAQGTGTVTLSATAGNIDLTGATVTTTGSMVLDAGKDIILTGVALNTGTLTADAGSTIRNGSAAGAITAKVLGLDAGKNIDLFGIQIKAAGVSMIAAAGNIDLTGATVTTTGVMALDAGKDIILSGVTLNTGTLAADAGSTIHNGGAVGTITTKALALVAGKNINLSSTQISVGSGVIAPVANNAALTAMFTDPTFAAAVTGDPTLLGGLAVAGISPAAPAPNAMFEAGDSVTLGTVNLTGSYLYLQADSISLLGPVTVPKGAVVQLTPNGVTGTTDAEGTGAAGATLNLNDAGLFNVFPDGITLVLGGAGQSGAVTLGNNGPFNIGSDNLIVDTTGTVTGLGNVISTGQVVSLSSLLVGVPPVTAGEIDPTSSTTTPNTDKDKHDQDEDANGEGQGGTISQDTAASSVCH